MILGLFGVLAWIGIGVGAFDRLGVGMKAVVLFIATVGATVLLSRGAWVAWRSKRGGSADAPPLAYAVTLVAVLLAAYLAVYIGKVVSIASDVGLRTALRWSAADAWSTVWSNWMIDDSNRGFFFRDFTGDVRRNYSEIEARRIAAVRAHLAVAVSFMIAGVMYLRRKGRAGAATRA